MQYDSILIKRENLDTEPQTQGECRMKVKAEMRVVLLQIKGHQRSVEMHQKLRGRHGINSLSQQQKESNLPAS